MEKKPLTIRDAIALIKNKLQDKYPPGEIRRFTELIFEHFLDYSKTDILINSDTKIFNSLCLQIENIIDQLLKHKPIQYILGEAWFYGLKLKVTPDVLIPRPETEELVRWITEDPGSSTPEIIDIGTGSGCIAIALAVSLPGSHVSATDVSDEIISIAAENALLCGANINFIKDNIFDSLIEKSEKYDIIVSNPPYVTESEKLLIGKNVLHYEPVSALFVPDNQSLIYYEAITGLARKALRPGGRLFFEINESKYREMEELLNRRMFSHVELKKDINGKYRMVKAVF
jgi:release factor glutamine methyltransferase